MENKFMPSLYYTPIFFRILLIPILLIIILVYPLPGFNSASGSVSSRRNEVVIAIEKAGNSVVSLSTEKLVAQRHMDPFFGYRSELFDQFFNDFFRNYKRKMVEAPLGSGVIIDEEGYIVTNEHVISRASKIKVTLSDSTRLECRIVSSDPINDLAILKVDSPSPLPSIQMGSSKNLMIGETVIALGNPFGLENSVTTGVLSATNRTLNFGEGKVNIEYKDLIQTDALINPGNSGGPLININGELIGINTAILHQGQGIGFAIPVDRVKQVLVNLLNFQEINKVWLGIEAEDIEPGSGGIKVIDVETDSPAAKEGVKKGDIITILDDIYINNVLEYKKYMLKKNVNDPINITLLRNQVTKKIKLILAKVPLPSTEGLARDRLGLFIQELTPSISRGLGIRPIEGVLVSGIEENSPAYIVGIKAGYIIVRVGPYRITNLEELGVILSKVQTGELLDVGLIWVDAFGEHQGYARMQAR